MGRTAENDPAYQSPKVVPDVPLSSFRLARSPSSTCWRRLQRAHQRRSDSGRPGWHVSGLVVIGADAKYGSGSVPWGATKAYTTAGTGALFFALHHALVAALSDLLVRLLGHC